MPSPENRVHVIEKEYGRLGSVPESQLEMAIKSGKYRPATDEEINYYKEQDEWNRPLQAAMSGYLSSVTLGASDLITSAIGGERARHGLQKLEEHNPLAYSAGTIAGFITPGGPEAIAARGVEKVGARYGGKVLGAALRAPSLPGRALRGAGLAAERGVIGAMPKALPGTAKVLGMGAQGAVEGAGFGFQQYIHETALGDAELNGEKLAASVLDEALSGGMIGAGFGMAGQTLKGIGKAFAATGGVSKRLLYNMWGEGAVGLSRVPKKLIDETFNPLQPLGRSNINLVRKSPEAIEAITRDTRRMMGEIADDLKIVDSQFYKGEKIRNLENLLPDDPSKMEALGVGVFDFFQTFNGKLMQMARQPRVYSRPWVKSMKRDLDNVWAKIIEEVKPFYNITPQNVTKKDVKEFAKILYRRQDEMKRIVGNAADGLARRAKKGGKNSIPLRATSDAFTDVLRTKMIPHLEDSTLWGRAAVVQKKLNEKWTKQISASKNFEKMFVGEMFSPGIGGKKRFIKDSPWKTYVSRKADDPGNPVGGIVTDYINETREHVKNIDELVELAPEYKDRIKRITRNLDIVHKKLKKVEHIHMLKEMYDTLSRGRGMRLSAPIGWGPTALMFSGQPAAGAAMWAGLKVADSLANPISTINSLAGVENFLHRNSGKLSSGIRKFARGAADTIRRTEAVTSRSTPEYARVENSIRSLSPEEAKELTIRAMSNHAMPAHAVAAGEAAERGQQLMLSMIPTPQIRPHLQAPKPQASKAELQNMNKVVTAVRRPQQTILEDMNNGRLTQATVETVKQVYPEQLEELQREAFENVVELDSADKQLAFGKRLQLEILLDEEVSGLTNWQYMQEMQVAYASTGEKQEPQSARRGQSIEISKQFESGSQRTEEGTYKS